MESKPESYAGLEISSGRRPVLLAILGSDLNVLAVQQCSVPDAISRLDEFNAAQLAINVPGSTSGQATYSDLKKKLKLAGFSPASQNPGDRKWIESNAQEFYRAIRAGLFPRRTLEGRIQRALILHEQGVKIHDPMDFFEEITRHKLLKGILPDENMYSVKQLDALAVAYVAWMAVQRPHKVEIRGDRVLTRIMEDD